MKRIEYIIDFQEFFTEEEFSSLPKEFREWLLIFTTENIPPTLIPNLQISLPVLTAYISENTSKNTWDWDHKKSILSIPVQLDLSDYAFKSFIELFNIKTLEELKSNGWVFVT